MYSLWIPKFLALWPWPWLLTYFLKNLTLATTFEPKEIGISYVYFLWQDLPVGTKKLPPDLDLDFWPTFQKNLILATTFEPKEIGLSYFTCVFLVARPSCWNKKFYLLTLTFTFDILLKKKLNLDHNFWTKSDRAYLFLVTRPFCWYQYFWPSGLDLDFDLLLEKKTWICCRRGY